MNVKDVPDFRAKVRAQIAERMAMDIDDIMFNTLTKQAKIEPEPLFTDDSGGFQFVQHNWNIILRQGERERFYTEAVAHRDEALSRMVQCRLQDRKKEADHWHASMRFLENSFRIPPHEQPEI